MRLEWRWSKSPRSRDTASILQERLRWGVYLISAALLGGILLEVPAYLQKWLWMRQLGYLEIFWTMLSIEWGMFFLGFTFAFLFFWSNIRQALRSALPLRGGSVTEEFGGPWGSETRSNPRNLPYGLAWLRAVEIGTSAVVAWAFALAFSSNWDSYLRFRYGGNYGLRDPLFGIDVGFYLFHLPFYELEQHFLGYLTFITLAAVVGIYVVGSSFLTIGGSLTSRMTRSAIRHTSALLFVLVALAG
jgi:uncharacterized protein